jgi:hypothetical protein
MNLQNSYQVLDIRMAMDVIFVTQLREVSSSECDTCQSL